LAVREPCRRGEHGRAPSYLHDDFVSTSFGVVPGYKAGLFRRDQSVALYVVETSWKFDSPNTTFLAISLAKNKLDMIDRRGESATQCREWPAAASIAGKRDTFDILDLLETQKAVLIYTNRENGT
jgi:hypothetical protein